MFAQAAPALTQRTFTAPDGWEVTYGLAVPGDYDPRRPRPLVLALHPGGGESPFYGDSFMRNIFLPGLHELAPIMIAPDVVSRSWTEPRSERAVLALIAAISKEFAVDQRRIAVVGFSMGAAGAWHLSARHPELFTAAIIMAGRSEDPVAALARMPTYVIHSRTDDVVPFAQALERVTALERMGRVVKFEALPNVGHFAMADYLPALERAGRWVTEEWNRAAAR